MYTILTILIVFLIVIFSTLLYFNSKKSRQADLDNGVCPRCGATAKEFMDDDIIISYADIVYKKEVLEKLIASKENFSYTNDSFDKTNMVSTLFYAKDFMDDDLIISYADIVYDKRILEKLLRSKDDFSVVVDRKWKELWTQRMENPLDDAETLKVKNAKIVELGKKPINYDDIEGQYIGLIKISKDIINKVINYYDSLDKNVLYDTKDFDNMYMTSFIQLIIENLLDVKPIFIDGGWVEIDCIDDLNTKMIL